MKDDPNPDQEKSRAGSDAVEGAEHNGDGTNERAVSFSRRALIEAGWTVPVVLSVVLPERVLAQSPPRPPVIHIDYHGDDSINEHSDAPFTDGTAHNDNPHGDTPHGDVHIDSGPTPPHIDIGHVDGHLDEGFADGGFDDHSDGSPPQHTDDAHVDSHTDFGPPIVPEHGDFHGDVPHLDYAFNIHGDHSDGQPPPNPPGGGAFTDHTDGFCRTTHGDDSHGDENTHVDHYDITPNAIQHDDHCDTPTGHADTSVGHIDAHADRHADIEHADVHLDFTRP
jgi:hypothetical protein